MPTHMAPLAERWMTLKGIARVAVTSQDPNRPIKSVFKRTAHGWRASQPGEQTIRLIFERPQPITRIHLRFSETESTRTQEFSLQWRPDRSSPAREIVRQQWNFSPHGSTIETEDYKVNLDRVGILEL